MDYRFFYHNLTGILLKPVKTWEAIYSEIRPLKDLRNSYFLPLIIPGSIAAFLGSMFFINATRSPVYSIVVGIRYFLLLSFVVYCSTVVLREITKALDLGKDFAVSLKLIVNSLTPFLLCQIISRLFESLIFINILSLYGLYIFWTGAEKMLNPPEHKKIPLLIAAFIVFTELFISINFLLTIVLDRLFYSIFT
jgi:hypothetical protein